MSGLVHALVHEVGALIPVSVRVGDGVCASLPCVLGPDGPSAPLWPQMTDSSATAWDRSLEVLADRERVAADLIERDRSSSVVERRAGAAIAAPISSDAVAAGDGAFSTCTRAPDRADREVVDELAVGADRLRAHTRRARRRDRRARSPGSEAPHGGGEAAPAQRPGHLVDPEAPVARGEPPEARERERVAQVPDVDAAPLVALAREREHRVRPDVHVRRRSHA